MPEIFSSTFFRPTISDCSAALPAQFLVQKSLYKELFFYNCNYFLTNIITFFLQFTQKPYNPAESLASFPSHCYNKGVNKKRSDLL